MEKKILEILADIDKNIPEYNGDNLFNAGLLDSFQVIELVTTLEDAFNIEIDPSYVIEENFATPSAIIALMNNIVS